MRKKKQETRNKKLNLLDFIFLKHRITMSVIAVFLMITCQVENKDEVTAKHEKLSLKRTESSTACGDHDTEGCREVFTSRSFFYSGCEYIVVFRAFICPDRIILDPIGLAIASGSTDCLHIKRNFTDYWMTPFVGVQLSSDYERLIRNNITDQVRDHIVNNVLNSTERNQFRCTQQNPCEAPTTFTFSGIRKDCFTLCVDNWEPDPEEINVSLVNLKRVLCGQGGCCEKKIPFCFDESGNPCFGTPDTHLISECNQNFTLDECIVSGQYCPTICNN
jgi:hypothetical protein